MFGDDSVERNREQFINILKESSNIVFFGGAGVSTASNIPDFRSANGIFNEKLNRQFTPEQLVSHSFFVKYPEDFYQFYKEKLIYPDAKPNACHKALVKLEEMGKLKGIVTQNIDGLHQMAGSKVVYELHGSVHRNYCLNCGAFYDTTYLLQNSGVPKCKVCEGIVKPDVVLYEEGLEDEVVSAAITTIAQADTLIIGGTSLVVYPAAGLIHYFRGKHLVLINKSITSADNKADLVLHEAIDEGFAQAVQALEEV